MRTLFRLSSSTILLITALFPCSPPVHAGGVVASADESSLRAAMAGGGTVTFATDGTIVLSSTLVITNDTVIDGSGHTVAISGNNSVRVFQINPDVLFTLANVIVANGSTNTGAGLYNAGAMVTIANCLFATN